MKRTGEPAVVAFSPVFADALADPRHQRIVRFDLVTTEEAARASKAAGRNAVWLANNPTSDVLDAIVYTYRDEPPSSEPLADDDKRRDKNKILIDGKYYSTGVSAVDARTGKGIYGCAHTDASYDAERDRKEIVEVTISDLCHRGPFDKGMFEILSGIVIVRLNGKSGDAGVPLYDPAATTRFSEITRPPIGFDEWCFFDHRGNDWYLHTHCVVVVANPGQPHPADRDILCDLDATGMSKEEADAALAAELTKLEAQ